MATTTNISAVATEHDGIEEWTDGYAIAAYTLEITIGEKTHEIDCWSRVGWIMPGASQDLDGSGLPNWGDSQEGGWSQTDGDGQMSGRPRVDKFYDRHDYDAEIQVHHDTSAALSITPSDVPEWLLLVHAADDLLDLDDDAGYDAACAKARKCRNLIAASIESAIEKAPAPKVDEPISKAVYDELDPLDGQPDISIRGGNYRGCGKVSAYLEDGKYRVELGGDLCD